MGRGGWGEMGGAAVGYNKLSNRVQGFLDINSTHTQHGSNGRKSTILLRHTGAIFLDDVVGLTSQFTLLCIACCVGASF